MRVGKRKTTSKELCKLIQIRGSREQLLHSINPTSVKGSKELDLIESRNLLIQLKRVKS